MRRKLTRTVMVIVAAILIASRYQYIKAHSELPNRSYACPVVAVPVGEGVYARTEEQVRCSP